MSFFDKNTNPFMKMFEQMSQEEQDRYTKMGDYMYGIVDLHEKIHVCSIKVPAGGRSLCRARLLCRFALALRLLLLAVLLL